LFLALITKVTLSGARDGRGYSEHVGTHDGASLSKSNYEAGSKDAALQNYGLAGTDFR